MGLTPPHSTTLGTISTFLKYNSKYYLRYYWLKCHKKYTLGASLVAQWLRICLPMQGTRVRVLVWEDPTCCGATKPVSHNY